jgi:hypothetical protein
LAQSELEPKPDSSDGFGGFSEFRAAQGSGTSSGDTDASDAIFWEVEASLCSGALSLYDSPEGGARRRSVARERESDGTVERVETALMRAQFGATCALRKRMSGAISATFASGALQIVDERFRADELRRRLNLGENPIMATAAAAAAPLTTVLTVITRKRHYTPSADDRRATPTDLAQPLPAGHRVSGSSLLAEASQSAVVAAVVEETSGAREALAGNDLGGYGDDDEDEFFDAVDVEAERFEKQLGVVAGETAAGIIPTEASGGTDFSGGETTAPEPAAGSEDLSQSSQHLDTEPEMIQIGASRVPAAFVMTIERAGARLATETSGEPGSSGAGKTSAASPTDTEEQEASFAVDDDGPRAVSVSVKVWPFVVVCSSQCVGSLVKFGAPLSLQDEEDEEGRLGRITSVRRAAMVQLGAWSERQRAAVRFLQSHSRSGVEQSAIGTKETASRLKNRRTEEQKNGRVFFRHRPSVPPTEGAPHCCSVSCLCR